MKLPSIAKKACAALAIATGVGGCVSYEETTRYRSQPAYGYSNKYNRTPQCPVVYDGYGRAYQTRWNGYRCG